ncbi:DUF1846 family protein [Candidatus Uhrbacteria bacterium]|nr:DUF1846 family protein [Candidatus Uhrbacteria bacterium]
MILFDNERYVRAQVEEILRRLALSPVGGTTYIEFGGKPMDDHHAARVLPGYDPDVKLRLLRELQEHFQIVVVVSARDLLRPRLRGDTQLFYDRETIRLITHLRDVGVRVDHGVISMVRADTSPPDRRRLRMFIRRASRELGLSFVEHPYLHGYPRVEVLSHEGLFAATPRLQTQDRHVLVFSPGGGSGKFGFILSQLWHDFVLGRNSAYLKFETFPVFNLAPDHPVNTAFMAATADLGNEVRVEGSGYTTYDKDEQNFLLLARLVAQFCPDPAGNPLSAYRFPSDMGVNRLRTGMLDDAGIRHAAEIEIARRIARYRDEIHRRIEVPETLDHLGQALTAELQRLIS